MTIQHVPHLDTKGAIASPHGPIAMPFDMRTMVLRTKVQMPVQDDQALRTEDPHESDVEIVPLDGSGPVLGHSLRPAEAAATSCSLSLSLVDLSWVHSQRR
ncbi:unnamed protein product [Symbiodinium natans]|uniref:Uncharacterized protein n=1 Tax=Symbiodinium natans TaxID=878477 RepID=A0A812UAQ0_9DINO|nr:unnamed protein product [Symbiodinium natans]